MKKLIVNIILLLTIICMANYSYAAGAQLEATMEISVNTIEVTAGDTVVFTFVIRDIANSEDNGKIYATGGKITYNTDFFEAATANGITLGSTGLFNSTSVVTEGATIGTISLKVKDAATGSGTVNFTELAASDGRLEDMETLGKATTPDETFTISIKQQEVTPPVEENPEPSEPETPPVEDKPEQSEPETPPVENDPEQGETENPPVDTEPEQTPPATGEDKKDNTTTETEKLPQTGMGVTLAVVIVLFISICTLAYFKYNKLKDI